MIGSKNYMILKKSLFFDIFGHLIELDFPRSSSVASKGVWSARRSRTDGWPIISSQILKDLQTVLEQANSKFARNSSKFPEPRPVIALLKVSIWYSSFEDSLFCIYDENRSSIDRTDSSLHHM